MLKKAFIQGIIDWTNYTIILQGFYPKLSKWVDKMKYRKYKTYELALAGKLLVLLAYFGVQPKPSAYQPF